MDTGSRGRGTLLVQNMQQTRRRTARTSRTTPDHAPHTPLHPLSLLARAPLHKLCTTHTHQPRTHHQLLAPLPRNVVPPPARSRHGKPATTTRVAAPPTRSAHIRSTCAKRLRLPSVSETHAAATSRALPAHEAQHMGLAIPHRCRSASTLAPSSWRRCVSAPAWRALSQRRSQKDWQRAHCCRCASTSSSLKLAPLRASASLACALQPPCSSLPRRQHVGPPVGVAARNRRPVVAHGHVARRAQRGEARAHAAPHAPARPPHHLRATRVRQHSGAFRLPPGALGWMLRVIQQARALLGVGGNPKPSQAALHPGPPTLDLCRCPPAPGVLTPSGSSRPACNAQHCATRARTWAKPRTAGSCLALLVKGAAVPNLKVLEPVLYL